MIADPCARCGSPSVGLVGAQEYDFEGDLVEKREAVEVCLMCMREFYIFALRPQKGRRRGVLVVCGSCGDPWTEKHAEQHPAVA